MLTNEKWFEFWKLRRDRVPNIAIATSLGISRQAVSKALFAIDGKIETALRSMAKANKISIVKINPQAWHPYRPFGSDEHRCGHLHFRKTRRPGLV